MPAGSLYVVATPIGNLNDLSPRARETLATVALVAAEDTRHTATLLAAFGIATPQTSLHQHNERERVAGLMARLEAGESVALVSDAGTPLISDPGFEVVREAARRGVRVVPIPGPSAVVAALSVSGLSAARFVFEGFLPARDGPRKAHIRRLRSEARTLVFYEAPHRLSELLDDLAQELGRDRQAVVARELTKHFETVYRGTLAELLARCGEDADMVRGEVVVVVAGAPADAEAGEAVPDAAWETLRVLLEELPAAQAAKLTAKLSGAPRALLYERAVAWKRGP